MKKYEFTGNVYFRNYKDTSVRLKEIIALKDFGNIKKGTVGGEIFSEDDLSHDDNSWVPYSSSLYKSKISENITLECSEIFESEIKGNGKIDNSRIEASFLELRGKSKIIDSECIFNLRAKGVIRIRKSDIFCQIIEGKISINESLILNKKPILTPSLKGNIKISNSDISYTTLFGKFKIFGGYIRDSKIKGKFLKNKFWILDKAKINSPKYLKSYKSKDKVVVKFKDGEKWKEYKGNPEYEIFHDMDSICFSEIQGNQ